MTQIKSCVAAAAAMTCVAGWLSVALAEPSSAATDKLSKISWIQGPWKADVGGDYLDEFWSPPHGDSMVGTFRWTKKQSLWMFELLNIVTEGDNIVLRVKHFDRAMVGWEEKDQAIVLPLKSQTPDESVFQTAEAEPKMVRLTYRKTGPSTMDIILEVAEPDKKDRRQEFHFTRMN